MLATFLIPIYESMGYKTDLGEDEDYMCQLDLSVFYLFKVACTFLTRHAMQMGGTKSVHVDIRQVTAVR